jgi:dihydrolipoamide dehydrogenase
VVDGAFRTTAEGIYAAGDILPTPMLAHTAQHEGIAAAEAAAGRTPRPLRYENTPMAIYTEPQAAWAGKTEEALKREGIPYRACRTYVKGNGKAAALGEKHGFAKLLVSPEGKILGAHIVGPEATELLAEACLAMEAGLPARAIAETVHAHPTLSEMVAEAARTAAI